jgi:hypothetical protein
MANALVIAKVVAKPVFFKLQNLLIISLIGTGDLGSVNSKKLALYKVEGHF